MGLGGLGVSWLWVAMVLRDRAWGTSGVVWAWVGARARGFVTQWRGRAGVSGPLCRNRFGGPRRVVHLGRNGPAGLGVGDVRCGLGMGGCPGAGRCDAVAWARWRVWTVVSQWVGGGPRRVVHLGRNGPAGLGVGDVRCGLVVGGCPGAGLCDAFLARTRWRVWTVVSQWVWGASACRALGSQWCCGTGGRVEFFV